MKNLLIIETGGTMSRTEASCGGGGVTFYYLLLLLFTLALCMCLPIPTHRSLPKSAPYTTVLKEFVGNSTENKACWTKQLRHCVRNEINMKTESDILLERIQWRMACQYLSHTNYQIFISYHLSFKECSIPRVGLNNNGLLLWIDVYITSHGIPHTLSKNS